MTSFEEEHKQRALEALKSTEAALTNDAGSFRKLLKGHQRMDDKEYSEFFHSVAVHYLNILLADSYLYSAIVTALQMDFRSYLKAGWLIRYEFINTKPKFSDINVV